MIVTTTTIVQEQTVEEYLGIVTGEAILGANIMKDLFAGVRDIVGGRSGAYEKELRRARQTALEEITEATQQLGASGIIGIELDYETVSSGSMLMVTASGTAVRLGPDS